MLRNKWMVFCLVIGSLLAVSTISSMPIYSNSIYQRMMIRDLQDYQVETQKYPGQITVFHSLGSVKGQDEKLSSYQDIAQIIDSGWISELGLPILAQSKTLSTIPLIVTPERYIEMDKDGSAVQVIAMDGIEEHADIFSGSYPRPGLQEDGCYEVMLAQNAMGHFGLSTGDIAVITPYDSNKELMEPIRVKITGVFRYADPSDLFWSNKMTALKDRLIIHPDTYEELFMGDSVGLTSYSNWSYALDYDEMRVSGAPHYRSVLNQYNGMFTSATTVTTPLLELMNNYTSRMGSLSITLWILQIPVILMLLLYIFMVSKIIVDHDSNDIAVQKSRGASNLQIFAGYAIEGGIVAVIGILFGPLIGYGLCSFLGLSNGFLEFVSRKGVLVELVPETYLYALLAIVAFLVTMLIPVMIASRKDIVKHKRSKSRSNDNPLWKKLYLDFILLALSLYLLFSYQNNIKMMAEIGLSGADTMDPLLFMISTLFILSAALVFLRIYPFFVRFVFWAGKKHWGAGTYASLIQVSRTKGSIFLMVFLIMTVSLGIFNSISARTINTFTEDQVKYQAGADLVLESSWPY